jgi:hypothetical protein
MPADNPEQTYSDLADLPPGLHRPAMPVRGLGTRLRGYTGVREEILDWVPEERARYTRLGAIVVNTGLMAGLSLLVALRTVTAEFWVFLIPAVIFWAHIVMSFDTWLVASTHGILNAARMRVFIPRLVISLLMGVVIAEPLLLWIFQPAIHKKVLDERQFELTAYGSQWKVCNPVSGLLDTSPACARFQVDISDSPQVLQAQLSTANANSVQLRTQIDAINNKRGELENKAESECSGTSGAGLSGRRGQGPNCRRDRQVADQYRTDSQLDQRQSALTSLTNQITDLTDQLAQTKQRYGTQVASAIDKQVRQKKADEGGIGILDEDTALGDLSGQSSVVLVAQWLVRLLLIAIDLLPALTKMMSGSTRYDELVTRQLDVGTRLHDGHISVCERRDAADNEVRMRRIAFSQRSKLEKIDEADRSSRADREADLEDEIDALAARLRQSSSTTTYVPNHATNNGRSGSKPAVATVLN